jgi:putative flippase GtrA
MAIMFIFVSLLHLDDKIIKLITQVIVIVLNYILSKFLVFIKPKESKKAANNSKEKSSQN